MNKDLFVELVFPNRETMTIRRDCIVSVKKSPDGSVVTIKNDPVVKIVVSPCFDDLIACLRDRAKRGCCHA